MTMINKSVLFLLVAAPALATTLLGLSPARAQGIQLVGKAEVPGDLKDGLELEPPLLEDGKTPHDQVGGWGSALAYTGVGNLYLAAPDRGPADGTTSYLDRAYLFDIQLHPGVGTGLTVALRQATLLTNDQGQLLTGSAAAFDASNSTASRRFDPEGIVLSGRGTFYISDEYGPFLYEFGAGGDRHKAKPIPEKFLISSPAAEPATELKLASGRQANRGMEGLAISPDGNTLYGLMQNALLQDGALDPTARRVGFNTRLLALDVPTHQSREYVYVMEHRGNGLNEILAINDHEFLVIERDGDAGTSASRKKIFKIDISGASDVSGVAALPTSGLPAGVVPVQKSLFIDLLDPAHGLAGPSFPEKIEGLAFGPLLPDGRLSLLVTSDNDFGASNPSRVFAFAIPPALLPGFTRLTLQVDVSSAPQRIEPGRPGMVLATIAGSQLLPVSAIDTASLKLGGAAVTSTGPGRPLCRSTDRDDDGFPDLLCLFDQGSMNAPARAREVVLSGQTDSGSPVQGAVPIARGRR